MLRRTVLEFVLALLLSALATHAMAGDSAARWTGWYAGINGGYGFRGDSEAVVDTERIVTNNVNLLSARGVFGSLDEEGGFGGVQLGYSAQSGAWVFGVEADLQRSDISDSSHGVVPNFLPNLTATVDTTNDIEWFATLRPRIGYSWGPLLIYGTAGAAWADIDHRLSFTDNFQFRALASQNSTGIGYVVGGGGEYALTGNLSLKLEYQYLDLGTLSYAAPLRFCPGGNCVPTIFVENTKTATDFQTVRVGLNWKFNNWAP